MRFSINLTDQQQLSTVESIPIREVVLHPAGCSREGSIDSHEIDRCLERLQAAGKTCLLTCDRFSDDNDLERAAILLRRFQHRIEGVRFLDPGLGLFLNRSFPLLPIHFLAEHGQMNSHGVKRWVECFQPGIDRIVLSNQVPISALETMLKDIHVETEIAGLGSNLLCYSPRKLVDDMWSQDDRSKTPGLRLVSHDRPNQPLFMRSGGTDTRILSDSDLFLLDRLQRIEAAGIEVIGLYPHRRDHYDLLRQYFPEPGWQSQLAQRWPQPLSPGFFNENPTDQLLPALTNPHLQKQRTGQVGHVLEAVKPSHLVIQLQKKLHLPCRLLFATPEGKSRIFRLEKLADLKQRTCRSPVAPGNYLMKWIKPVVPTSLIILREDSPG